MNRAWLWPAAGLGLLVTQTALLPALGTSWWTPDLFLVATAAVAFFSDPRRGQMAGFGAGFLQDLFASVPLGFHAFTKTLLGFLLGFTNRFLYRDNPLALPLAVFLASWVENALAVALAAAFGLDPQPLLLWQRPLANALVALGVDRLWRRWAPPADGRRY